MQYGELDDWSVDGFDQFEHDGSSEYEPIEEFGIDLDNLYEEEIPF